MSYADTLSAHLRLTVLRLLAEQPEYALNEAVLRDLVIPFGFLPSRDQLRTQLTWLAEQGLITREDLSGLWVATITPRGEDVAMGRVEQPGVKRPGPKP